MRKIIVNSTPLIALAKANKLEILKRMYEHTEKTIDRMTFMFESIRAFPTREDLRDE